MIRQIFRHALIAALAFVLLAGLSGPLAHAQDGVQPRTLTDVLDREITLDAPPQRIVGMSASITEMLFAIGVQPVGATEGVDYPPAAADLPTFGVGYQPDLEALAALEPDLIVANAMFNRGIIDQLEAIAPTFFVLTRTLDDIPQNIRLLGQLTWHDTEADYLAMSYEHYLDMAASLGQTLQGPDVLIIVGTLKRPNYGKSSTYLGSMVAMLGANNIADGEKDAGPFPGYAQLSMEAILDADPDVILTVTRGSDTPMPESMRDDPMWSALTAVQEGRVYELDNRLFVESPGPRFVQAFAQLYDLFYGEGTE